MKTHLNTSLSGFTLVEMMITIGIISILASLSLFDGVSSYMRGMARNDRSTTIAALRETRDMAVHGICTQSTCTNLVAHGIRITAHDLTLFEGSSYTDRYVAADELIPLSGTRSTSGDSEIVFVPGTGNTLRSSSFSLIGNDDRTEDIMVNTYGTIDSNLRLATTTL